MNLGLKEDQKPDPAVETNRYESEEENFWGCSTVW